MKRALSNFGKFAHVDETGRSLLELVGYLAIVSAIGLSMLKVVLDKHHANGMENTVGLLNDF